jgi:hypothetical protein
MASRLFARASGGRRANAVASFLVAAALAFGATALAQPTAADKDAARALMAEGRADRDKGNLPAARKAFAAADAIMHVPTTGLELARALVALGRLVEADDTALRVARIPEKPSDTAPFKAARDAALRLNDELESRIPSLSIQVRGTMRGATPSVTIDDTAVPAELLGQPRKVDPGHYVIVAKAGAAESKQEVDLAERETKEVTLELEAPAVSSEAPQPANLTPPTEETRPEPRSGGASAMLYGGVAVAGAGIVLGTIAGIVSLAKTNDIKNSGHCKDDMCSPVEHGDIATANTMATVSTVSFAVAGAGAVVGVIGLFLQSHATQPDDASASKTPRVEPWLGIGTAGVRGRF